MSDLPEGYRMSEVGVIPEEWEVVNYGVNLNIISGLGFNKSEYVDYGIKLLRIDNVSYGEIIWESIAFLPMNYKNKYTNLIINNNDILLALNRPITNGKLKIAIVEPKDIPCILYQRVGKIIFLNNLYDRKFAYYLLSKFIKKFVEESSVGSDQPFISTTKLKQIKIPLPPLPEQQAIASALSDVDALITALEQLITKKRNIKQGAMQQLLTGKKRLPGFGGAWEVKKLGDCLTKNPDYGINAPSVPYSDNLPVYIRITDISEDGRFLPEKITSVDDINSNNYFLEKDDLVFARTGASTGKTYLYNPKDGKLVFAGFLIRVKVNSQKLDPLFLKGYTETTMYWHWVNIMSMRSGQPGINGNEFSQLSIPLPPLPEQTAIAQILFDMDTEIESLKQKRDKYKAIKQGMMQELLTGKRRLA